MLSHRDVQEEMGAHQTANIATSVQQTPGRDDEECLLP